MAIRNAEFEAWVNEIKPTEWGAYVSVSHERRAKNPATDTWETVGRDYIDASVPAELLPIFEANKLVKITANIDGTPNAYLSKTGEAKATLKVRVTAVVPVERRGETEVSPQLNTGLAERPWIPSEANMAASFGAKPVTDEEVPF
jgi:hypothetical protein